MPGGKSGKSTGKKGGKKIGRKKDDASFQRYKAACRGWYTKLVRHCKKHPADEPAKVALREREKATSWVAWRILRRERRAAARRST